MDNTYVSLGLMCIDNENKYNEVARSDQESNPGPLGLEASILITSLLLNSYIILNK